MSENRSETRKDWSLLEAWCGNQADLEETESWMCAPKGERQAWQGSASFYRRFAAEVEVNDWTPEQIQRWLDGAIQAAKRISERVTQLAEEKPNA